MTTTVELLPQTLYTAAGTRELDRIAIEEAGIPGIDLMKRAGEAAFRLLEERWPKSATVTVVCGNGNNGGDGYVLAKLAKEAGKQVHLLHHGDLEQQKGDALTARLEAEQSGLVIEPYQSEKLDAADVVVDALLGTGLDRQLDQEWQELILDINQHAAHVLSIDIPSGLHADSGSCMNVAVTADVTITFIGLKRGLFSGSGPAQSGAVYFDGLDVPASVFEKVAPSCERIDEHYLATMLRPRPANFHKGDCGHVLVIGGDYGYAGAVRMAGEAALRSGAGLVTVASREEHCLAIPLARPELMTRALASARDLEGLTGTVDVVVIGPGLGQSAWAMDLFARVLELDIPILIDADGLNLLAQEPVPARQRIITPHPGEAARLLGCSVADIQQDRFQAVVELQQRYGGVCVLKGSGSLVMDEQALISVCDAGNPGMASGGMGDVLSGVIAAMIAQGKDLPTAARLGVVLHSAAADRAAVSGERGMIATDLMKELRSLANPG